MSENAWNLEYEYGVIIDRPLFADWTISDIIDGHRVKETFYGFTMREACEIFRAKYPKGGDDV